MKDNVMQFAGTGATVLVLSGNYFLEVHECSIEKLKGFTLENRTIRAVIRSSDSIQISAKDLSLEALNVPLIKVSSWGQALIHTAGKLKQMHKALNIRI